MRKQSLHSCCTQLSTLFHLISKMLQPANRRDAIYRVSGFIALYSLRLVWILDQTG